MSVRHDAAHEGLAPTSTLGAKIKGEASDVA